MQQNEKENLIINMEHLLSFESYNFENLDRSWIKNVWDSSFTNIDNIPMDYLVYLENQGVNKTLDKTCGEVKNWISQNDRREEISWQTLIGSNLDVQALLAILAFFIKQGQAFDANHDSRQSCLRATSLYFVLLSIPGSNVFQAFHPDLYEAALKTLTLSQRLSPSDAKTSKKSNLNLLNEDFALEDDDFQTPRNLPKSESIIVMKNLNGVLFDLITMLKSVATSLDMRSLQTTIFHLVEMTKLANEAMSDFSLARHSEASINSLAYNAYVALRFICNSKYSTIPIITRIIGKYVLPQLLISSTNKLSPKQQTIIRDSTIHFLKTLLEKHGSEAQEALVTLIQHLMIKSPERLEGRQKQAVVVIKLMNICQGNEIVYKKCLKDLMLFSVHYKISCRIFAQEIIGKYLLDLSASENRRNNENNWSSSSTNKLLLAAALSRCDDSSSMVRGRAIATFAEYTDCIEKPEVRSIFRGEREYEAREMPSFENLVAAIEENEVEKALPNFRDIIEMLKRRCEDERALVRRSSLQALRNGIFVFPELLDEVTPLLTIHCRDGALTVRKFAIRVFTIIMETYSENSILCKNWVDSVVPRVFDSETKVQEEVLNSLEKLILEKIVKTGSGNRNASDENLPWRILRELARNKMRDYLTKACSIWINAGKITPSVIANIKSHIGTENNMEAWLLLGSFAENISLGNMDNYYTYFEKALKDDDSYDGFLASVILQVLLHSWPSFQDKYLRNIENVIFNNLEVFRVRETLISHCLDILHGIRIFRSRENSSEPEDGTKAMERLTTIAETTISRLVDDEDVENDDQDAGKMLLRATCTLGHASFLCTAKIEISTLRILQGFLLEWNSLSSRIRATKALQGAAVAVLGQQALRDRQIAQEMVPIFGKLLRNTRESSNNSNIANGAAVRINAAKALADISVRFTALVEPFLPDMCISMKDPDPQVRQVILVIFIQLLAEDFIMINGPFFFNILSMLSDSDETIRQMTVFLVKERLISKNKSLITQQFINCIYHLNDYDRRLPGNRKGKRRPKELEILTIPGEKGAEKRRRIYDFMLQHLDAPGKLRILVGLSRQILQSTCTNKQSWLRQLNVTTEKGIWVFRDALYVVGSDYLQPNSCAKQNIDEESLDDTTPTPAPSAASSVIVEAMKKHRLEIFLPGLVELKERLTQSNSRLYVDVAKLISSLLNDYNKDQLENLYKEYPELDKEIERDIRKFDEEEIIFQGEIMENALASSTPKKSKFDASLIVHPDWMPRIVLRRISTLTYPEISQLRERTTSENGSSSVKTTQSPAKIAGGSPTPRVVVRRLEDSTNPEFSKSRIETNFKMKNASRAKKGNSSLSTSEQIISRKTRSSSFKECESG